MATITLKPDTRSSKESYFGGKGQDGVFQTIINEIPACVEYWELFAGNASIYRRLTNKPQRCFLVEKDHKQAKKLAQSLGVLCFPFDFVLFNVINKAMYSQGTFVVWGSAFEVLELMRMEHLDKPTSYFFVDPPYLLETRSSNTRYNHELTAEEHAQLLNYLLKFQNAQIGICTYPNPTYSAVLDQWRKVEYKSVTRNRGEVRTEYFYMNYAPPTWLQDTHYIGKDYREREAYRKQQKNWLKNFKAMHPHQQQAVLKQLNEAYNP